MIQEGTGSQERGAIQEGTGSQERGAVGLRPLVDGGSVPVSNFQQGGSSGSHGMQADPLPDLCYEDYFGDAMSVERFPYVGSWLQIHYMMHVFSQAGEQVLWALGEPFGGVVGLEVCVGRYKVRGVSGCCRGATPGPKPSVV